LRKSKGEPIGEIDNLLGMDELMDFTGRELGRMLEFTLAEYKELGALRHRHPSQIRPSDANQWQVEAYLKEFQRPRKAARRRQLRAKARADQAARRQAAADLDCRLSALATVVTDGWQTVAQLAAAVADCPAFQTSVGKPLVGDSVCRTIRRLLPKLLAAQPDIETKERTEKHGCKVILVRRPPI
jgi:hypothetical protein